jgi:stage V sporulation protein S
MSVLRVSSQSNPNAVAGAIASVVREAGTAEVQVIGAGALNQAVKAVAIARGYLSPSGIDLVCIPSFTEVSIDGELRTAIRLALHDRFAKIDADEASFWISEPDPAPKDSG